MAMPADTGFEAVARTIDVARPRPRTDITSTLRGLAEASGRTLGALIREWIGLSFGPGKLSFDEYVALGLYDAARFEGADLKSFVGLEVMQNIWQQINFRADLCGTTQNKVGLTAILAAHGFPTIPVVALYSEAGGFPAPHALQGRQALRDFLTSAAPYPLFGKPMDSFQSLGSASFASYASNRDALFSDDGRATSLDAYLDDVTTNYSGGYIFQRRVSPHPETRAICGDRLATVRVITLHGESEPKVLRACQKVPAAGNAADNFWREGNLLAELDLETGERRRVVSGRGLAQIAHSTHPDTGAPITGTCVPEWQAVCALALEGAKLLKDLPLIGWDIAPVAEGALIVEANNAPDLFVPQVADRRGILDAELLEAIHRGREANKAWLRALHSRRRESLRQSFMR